MTQSREYEVKRIHQDHEYLFQLIEKVKNACADVGERKVCWECPQTQRGVCQGNVQQLIRHLVEVTLKHHLLESVFMADKVPKDHRVAHMQSHVKIAEEMKSIRVIFSEDGNCILAIEGVERVLASLALHIGEFDLPLEDYLLTAV